MPETHETTSEPPFEHEQEGGSTATATATRPAPPRVDRLPPWNVLLHNDDVNDMVYVVDTIVELTTLDRQEAIARMLEAHVRDLTLLLSTHREHAELLEERFSSKRLTVTIEPAR
ncbi:MAG: ATP-dependent Clp protease adaptor ClpS, partial [Planctomycetota bacterium]|jgi:ATP-dependent Clp protease adapter protein ClpS